MLARSPSLEELLRTQRELSLAVGIPGANRAAAKLLKERLDAVNAEIGSELRRMRRLEEAAASRKTATVRTIAGRELYFINPKVLSAFPLKMEGGKRRELFSNLAGKLAGQVSLREAQEKRRAAKTRARDRAKARLDRVSKPGRARAKAEAQLAEIELELAMMPMLHQLEVMKLEAGIQASAKALEPKVRQALAERSGPAGATALEAIEKEGIVVKIPQSDLEVWFGEGSGAVALHAVKPGIATERPLHGVKEGGNVRLSSAVIEEQIDRALRDVADPDERARRERLLRGLLGAFQQAEGMTDSLNTWDAARLTMGPGLAAAGKLQKALWRLKERHPEAFHDLVGRFGIDIEKDKRGASPIFTVVVPADASRSDWSRHIASGTVLRDNEAEEFIISDPVLMAALRRAAKEPFFHATLVEGTLSSAEAAWEFRFAAGSARVSLEDVLRPLGDEYVIAAQAVVANWKHGSGTTRRLAELIAEEYSRLLASEGIEDPADHASLSTEGRLELARFIAARLKKKRWNAFRDQFEAGPELWPADEAAP